MPRPIEIHAHDPLRYVGDMLAWVHQCIAGEREFLEGLFNMKGERRMVGSVRVFGETQDEEWIQELMDRAFEKLKSPLKVSINAFPTILCTLIREVPRLASDKQLGPRRVA